MQPAGGPARVWGVQKVLLGGVACLALATGCTSSSGPAAPPTPTSGSSSPATPQAESSSPTPVASSPGTSVRVRDVSFVSATTGWVLVGRAVLRTDDGGRSWQRVGAVPRRVAHLRFASESIGYAWLPSHHLWLTRDGGRHWVAGGLQHVDQVEIGAGLAWAIIGPLPGPHVNRSTVGSTSWTDLGIGPNRTATLDVHGDVAYITGQQGAGPIAPSLTVWTAGGGERDEQLPCVGHRRITPWAPVGVSTDGVVVLVCNQQDRSRSIELAYVSRDGARTWTKLPSPREAPTDVTASRAGVLAWGTTLQLLHEGSWHNVLPALHGFAYAGFVTDDLGIVLTRKGQVFRSRDGGFTWQPVHVGASRRRA